MTGSAMIRRLSSKFSINKTGRLACQIRCYSSKESDPLRILFCGSDEFSIKSLRALHQLQKNEPDIVKSIDVVSRPPKRTGRGLKTTREVPIAQVARDLHLPLHQIDTFTGWQPPTFASTCQDPINLIVAVSFGLLIPARLIQQSKYGGLNVHPSLLPEFRGAAPIHHVLLAGRSRTGVTLQTLHPKKMDHGKILLQTPPPGLEIPDCENITVPRLTELLAPVGAEILIQGIRNRLYVPPVDDLTPTLSDEEVKALKAAPKITPTDREIKWSDWTADEILRRQRVFGPLWNQFDIGDTALRVTWAGGFEKCGQKLTGCGPGEGGYIDGDPHIYLKSCDGKVLKTRAIKLVGYGEHPARQIALKVGLMDRLDTTTVLIEGSKATGLPPVLY